MNIAIVGSTRGIGLEFVKQLSEQNDVYAFCRSSNSDLKGSGAKKIIEGCDTANTQSIENSFKQIEGTPLDWVLVVSGVMEDENLSSWNDETILKQFQVNALGAINVARLSLGHLHKGSKIGLLTSRMGSIEDNTSGGRYGYRMSKAALNAAGKSLAMDLKEKNISVFLLHPGWVQTDMTGNTGQLTTTDSVIGLIKIMNEKEINESGHFFHTNGEELPW